MTALETYERPSEINENNIIYWSPEYKQTIGSIKSKALRFLRDGLINQVDTDEYTVSPIAGYNHTTYTVLNSECNCQGFKMKGNCSHCLAVNMFKTIKGWNNGI